MHPSTNIVSILTFNLKRKKSIAFIYCVLLTSAIFAFFRSYYNEPMSDDIYYKYQLHHVFTPEYYPDSLTAAQNYDNAFHIHSFENPAPKRIESFGDAVSTQLKQWHQHSGRLLVHTFVQYLTSTCKPWQFSLFNALFYFLATLGICVFAASHFKRKGNFTYAFLLAALTISIFYYLYQQTFPTFSNGKMDSFLAFAGNYIWPIPVSICYLFFLKHLLNNKTNNAVILTANFIIGFICGSTQEVFIFPLCILTLFKLLQIIKHKEKLAGNIIVLALGLWTASALVGLAPGTLNRGSGLVDKSLLSIILEGFEPLISVYPLSMTAVALVIILSLRKSSRKTLSVNFKDSLILLGSAMCLATVLHTTPASYSGVEFYSILFILSCLTYYLPYPSNKFTSCCAFTAACLIFGLFVGHQAIICFESSRVKEYNYNLVEAYIESPDGIVEYKPLTVSKYAEKFVFDFARNSFNPLISIPIQQAYGKPGKTFFPVNSENYRILSGIAPSSERLYVQGNTKFIALQTSTALFYIIKVTDILQDTITVTYSPATYKISSLSGFRVHCMKKLKQELTHSKEDTKLLTESVPIDELPSLNTRWGEYKIFQNRHPYRNLLKIEFNNIQQHNAVN